MLMTDLLPCRRLVRFAVRGLAVVLTFALLSPAGRASKGQDAGQLTLDRIFHSQDFQGDSVGPLRWLSRHPGYTTKAPSEQPKGASDLVRVDPASGRQEIVVAARHLVPPG